MVSYNCDRCGKNFFKLWKLRHHRERKYQCRQNLHIPTNIPIIAPEPQAVAPTPETSSQKEIPALIVHIKGKDRRKEKSQVVTRDASGSVRSVSVLKSRFSAKTK